MGCLVYSLRMLLFGVLGLPRYFAFRVTVLVVWFIAVLCGAAYLLGLSCCTF